MTRIIAKELSRMLAENHFDIIVKIKKTGNEFNIVKLLSKKIVVFTDKGTNEDGETVWATKVGVFNSIHEVAMFIEQVQGG